MSHRFLRSHDFHWKRQQTCNFSASSKHYDNKQIWNSVFNCFTAVSVFILRHSQVNLIFLYKFPSERVAMTMSSQPEILKCWFHFIIWVSITSHINQCNPFFKKTSAALKRWPFNLLPLIPCLFWYHHFPAGSLPQNTLFHRAMGVIFFPLLFLGNV